MFVLAVPDLPSAQAALQFPAGLAGTVIAIRGIYDLAAAARQAPDVSTVCAAVCESRR